MTSELQPLLDALAALGPVAAIHEQLVRPSSKPLHIAPVIGAARTPLVAALAQLHSAPMLYVVHTSEAAFRAAEDLAVWLGAERVVLFPAADALPYEHMSPAADLVVGRLGVLRQLVDAAQSPMVIVAPVKALTQPTFSRADLAAATTRIERGDTFDLDQLVERWITIGYRVAPTVEEPGEINRRGGIIEIFPPGDDMPLRIGVFGGELDSLRRF
ncbi:MAG TPA: transcription-repair coupling factor, partial [Roseiflexaceae bacterium]|nr:transcription-repair coupling factor [Roseiflexaceae bacterium]